MFTVLLFFVVLFLMLATLILFVFLSSKNYIRDETSLYLTGIVWFFLIFVPSCYYLPEPSYPYNVKPTVYVITQNEKKYRALNYHQYSFSDAMTVYDIDGKGTIKLHPHGGAISVKTE